MTGGQHTRATVDSPSLPRGGARDARQHRAVAEALAQERRRIAADVHDLIMQDLAFALASARALSDRDSAGAGAIVAAGERALAGARQVVDLLRGREHEPVLRAVRACVLAAARSTPVSFVATMSDAPDIQPDGPTLDALVHISREAVTNAVKHGAPTSVEVVLEHADEWRLAIRDDGCGFDPVATRKGIGLQSMNEQVLVLGGTLEVSSIPGAGTTLRASLP